MPKKSKNIILDINKQSDEIKFEVFKLDDIELIINLIDGEKLYNLENSGIELIMDINGKPVQQLSGIKIIRNKAIININNGAFDTIGRHKGKLKILNGEGIISTPSFLFEVKDTIVDDSVVINDVGIEVIDKIMDYMELYPDGGANTNHSHENFDTLETITSDDIAKLKKLEGLDDFAKKKDLDGKVDKVIGKGLSDENFTSAEKIKLSGLVNYVHPNDKNTRHITDEERERWNSTIGFSGDYNDLINKPEIPTVDVNKKYVDDSISGVDNKKVDKVSGKQLTDENFTLAEKNKLNGLSNYTHPSSHDASMITENVNKRFVSDVEKQNWNSKSNFDGNYNSLTNKPTIPPAYDDREIRLSLETITTTLGDENSGIVKDINDLKNNPTEGHAHENKTALDLITQDKIYKWDNAIGILISPSGKEFLLKVKDDGTLYTEENILPADFPTFTVVGESSLTNDFYITPHNDSTKGSYIFIMDYKGKVKWLKKIPNFAYSFRRYTSKSGRNRYTYHQVINDEFTKFAMNGGYDNTKLVILDENYNLLEEVRCKASGTIEANYPLENHDYIYIDDEHYIVTSYHNNTVTNVPSVASCSVVNCVIQEIKNGQVIFHWESIDHVELYSASHTNNRYADFTSTTYNDYAHLNSVVIDERDGNLLTSWRHIGLIKIHRTTGAILWIMGRNKNDISGSSSAQCGYLQHDARYNYDNSITIFDNSGCSTDNTRICRYWIDEDTKTLTKFKEYIVQSITRTPFMGSVTLIDDNLEIFDIAGYGSKGSTLAFNEYDFTNSVEKMKFKFDNNDDTYRIWRDISFNDVVKPGTKPQIKVVTDGLLMYVDGRDGVNSESTSVWIDRSENGYDITLTNPSGSYTDTNGWNGSSLVTNGADNSSIWGNCTKTLNGSFFAEDFTIELGYEYISGSSSARLLTFTNTANEGSNERNIFEIQLDKVRLQTKAPSGTGAYQCSGIIFNTVGKNRVIVTKENGVMNIYLNGTLVKSQESAWNEIEPINEYKIHFNYEGSSTNNNIMKSKAKWNYIRVYNKALSTTEIKINNDYEDTVIRN